MSFYRDYNDKLAYEAWNTRQQPVFKTIQVKHISRAGGAEISGVDLSEGLSADQFSEVRKALAEYQVLVFRDQNITSLCAEFFSGGNKYLCQARKALIIK
jgi:taurine dioxygenase